MGQKVNPNGLRLGVNKDWQSKWYAKSDYAKLLNNDLNLSYGSDAKNFVKQRFNPSKIVKEWHVLFEEINNNVPSIYQRPTGNYMNNYKFLRMLNKFLRNIPLMKWLPSIAFIECKIKSML